MWNTPKPCHSRCRPGLLACVVAAAMLLSLPGCGGGVAASSHSPSPSRSAAPHLSVGQLRDLVIAARHSYFTSLAKDVPKIAGAKTGDVFIGDPHGHDLFQGPGRQHPWSRVLIAAFASSPDGKTMHNADTAVIDDSGVGEGVYRLQGPAWALWSAGRAVLLKISDSLGGQLVQVQAATHPGMRQLRVGEHLFFRCGLSVVVPSDCDGSYVHGMQQLSGYDESMGPSTITGGPLGNVAIYSLDEQVDGFMPGLPRWPMVASSADGTVVVRCVGAHIGTAHALALIDVVVHLPGRPVGIVDVVVKGRAATTAQSKVMAQVAHVWRHFSITGAMMPTPGH